VVLATTGGANRTIAAGTNLDVLLTSGLGRGTEPPSHKLPHSVVAVAGSQGMGDLVQEGVQNFLFGVVVGVIPTEEDGLTVTVTTT